MAPSRRSKQQQREAAWALAARIIAFFFGLLMLTYGTVVLEGRSAAVLLAGVGLTGVPIAPVAEKLLDRLPGGKE
jgi:hypothetical protein